MTPEYKWPTSQVLCGNGGLVKQVIRDDDYTL